MGEYARHAASPLSEITGPWVEYVGTTGGEVGIWPEPGDRGRVVVKGKGRDRGLVLVAWRLRAPTPPMVRRPDGWQRVWVDVNDVRELGDG